MLSGLLAAESNNPSPLLPSASQEKKTEKDFAAMDGQMVAWMDDWINIFLLHGSRIILKGE